MLDDVERRAFLVQPARENTLPGAAGLLDVELDERPRQALIVPGRGGVARPQPHHRVAKADRFAGLQRDVADDAVALVEQAEHGNPLRHRRHAGDRLDRARRIEGGRGRAVGQAIGVTFAAPATGNCGRCQRQRAEAADTNYSGFHAR
jgi:hypothetical protein